MDYQQSGVNRDRADQLVQSISGMTKKTLNKNVKSSVGGYASLYQINPKQWIAASTDGVGTKLKLAFEWNAHDSIGQDLVAMSVNDLLCVGARPLFFLDYFATGKLDNTVAERVIKGIAKACQDSHCALVGGETAEMPGMYAPGEYDLAGFAIGMVSPKAILPQKLKPGLVLIGIESSGFHSNGYSLIRKLLELNAGKVAPFKSESEMRAALMRPTHLYGKVVNALVDKKWIKGAAHITGSGFLNVPRMSTEVNYEITLPPLQERAPVFEWITQLGTVPFEELCQTYNMGVGMVIAVEAKNEKKVKAAIKKFKFNVWTLGKTLKKQKSGSKNTKTSTVKINSAEGTCQLDY